MPNICSYDHPCASEPFTLNPVASPDPIHIMCNTCDRLRCTQVGVKVPLVVRLEGTHVDKGRAILKSSGLTIIAADDLDDAAKKAVAALA